MLPRGMGPAVIIPIFVAVVVLFVVFAAFAYLAEQRRRRAIAQRLEALGLTPSIDDQLAHSQAFARVGTLRQLKRGSSGIQWSARGRIHDLDLAILEHKYTTGSGKHRTTHHHTVAASPCPPAWPTLLVAREGFFDRVAKWMGGQDIDVEDEAFNKTFRVKCPSQLFAITLLAPGVQQAMLECNALAELRVGEGAVCLVARRKLDPATIERLTLAALTVRAAIPPELDEWSPAENIEHSNPPPTDDLAGEA
jgi:hypothetical protein